MASLLQAPLLGLLDFRVAAGAVAAGANVLCFCFVRFLAMANLKPARMVMERSLLFALLTHDLALRKESTMQGRALVFRSALAAMLANTRADAEQRRCQGSGSRRYRCPRWCRADVGVVTTEGGFVTQQADSRTLAKNVMGILLRGGAGATMPMRSAR